jgi:hypothetical protein
MDESQKQEKRHQKRVALIAAFVTFVSVILLGVVVYFALDRVHFKRLPTNEKAPSGTLQAPPASDPPGPFIFFEF